MLGGLPTLARDPPEDRQGEGHADERPRSANVVGEDADGGGEQVGSRPRCSGGVTDVDRQARRDHRRVTELHSDHLAVLVNHSDGSFANAVFIRDGEIGVFHVTILSWTSLA